MKYYNIIIFFSICIINLNAQSVGIGTTTPDSSAILDLSSTTKGFLMPRITTAQRDAIMNPAQGLTIFNTVDRCIDTYDGTSWAKNCTQKINGEYNLPADNWRPRTDFGGVARNSAVGFSIGGKGYVGTGNSGSTYLKDFWEYDAITNVWTQKADFGGTARNSAVGFSINGKGYIGTGYNNNFRKDFWEYDPITNVWIQKADFGGSARDAAVGFSIGSKGYIGTGRDFSFNLRKDFWEYDPTSNIWTQKTDFAGTARAAAVGFSINSKGYIGTGYDSAGEKKDFWEFDPGTSGSIGTWVQKVDFGGTPRSEAIGFSIGSLGYIGMGYGQSENKTDFWLYNPIANGWSKRNDFGGGATVGFSIGSSGYVGLSFINKDFWEYNSSSVNGKQYLETIPSNATKYSGIGWTSEGNKLYPSLENPVIYLKKNTPFEFGRDIFKETHAGKIGYKTFSSDGLDIVGAGVTYPERIVRIYDRLFLQNNLDNKKIVLWEGADNDHQFYGFGINNGTLRYQSEGDHRFYTGTSATTSNLTMTIDGNGNTTIAGAMCATAYNCASDATLKKNILPISSSLSSLFALKGYNYHWNDDTKDQTLQSGFLAQEVEKLFPHLVRKDEQGLLSVNYIGLMPYMLEGMKNLKKENDELRNKNNTLTSELTSLKADIEKRLSLLESKKL